MLIRSFAELRKERVKYRLVTGRLGYRVGNDGSVWSRITAGCKSKLGKTWRRLKQTPTDRGYLTVKLGVGKTYYVHILVLELFEGPCPLGKEARHRNGVQTDNRHSNLLWSTHVENNNDKRKHGTWLEGSKIGTSKIDEKIAAKIKRLLRKGMKPKNVVIETGATLPIVYAIKEEKAWKHVKI